MTFKYRLIGLILAGIIMAIFSLNSNIFEYWLKPDTIGVIPNQNQTIDSAQARILEAIGRDFFIAAGDRQYPIKPDQLKVWFEEYHRPYTNRQEFRPNIPRIEEYLKQLSENLDQSPVNGRFEINENGRIVEAVPARDGLKFDALLSAANIARALMQGRNSANLSYQPVKSDISLDRLSKLGINKLLAEGKSDFTGSSEARRHNIKVGAGVFNGVFLRPGEEFSFNQLLGPVEASAGYRYELVIKNKKLIPEYGGGICQVSTTLFRAAAKAGLPITERHAHSLPVRYYHPQGFDATIYPGVSDLRFINDTPGHILIQAEVASSSLAFEIYGSSDGRKVTIDGPHVYDVQTDGAMKAWLKRIVTPANGTEHKDIFYSNYQSPSLFPKIRNPLE